MSFYNNLVIIAIKILARYDFLCVLGKSQEIQLLMFV